MIITRSESISSSTACFSAKCRFSQNAAQISLDEHPRRHRRPRSARGQWLTQLGRFQLTPVVDEVHSAGRLLQLLQPTAAQKLVWLAGALWLSVRWLISCRRVRHVWPANNKQVTIGRGGVEDAKTYEMPDFVRETR